MAFVTSQLYEPYPVSQSLGPTVTVGAWLNKISQRSQHCPVSTRDFNSEKYKDTRWKNKGAGDWSSEGNAPRRNSIRLSVWETEMCCKSSQSHLLYLMSLVFFYPWGCAVLYCRSLVNVNTFDILKPNHRNINRIVCGKFRFWKIRLRLLSCRESNAGINTTLVSVQYIWRSSHGWLAYSSVKTGNS